MALCTTDIILFKATNMKSRVSVGVTVIKPSISS
jgi:hypothetical protein